MEQRDHACTLVPLRISASCVAGTLMVMVVPLHVLNTDPIPNPAYVVTAMPLNVALLVNANVRNKHYNILAIQ
jgi:hypothetical protein